jgi:catechol 2,3-dioxygenase-like lactoylglutathione lyase family enzyme
MFELDHVAIQTDDVPGSVAFYAEHFDARVLYADATWAFLRLGEGKLALVTPAQHPPHVARARRRLNAPPCVPAYPLIDTVTAPPASTSTIRKATWWN